MTPPNFNRIARPYRWLEYLTLGRALEHARFRFLPQIAAQRSALVLGDGDGRFLDRLLRHNSALVADAIDDSSAMLQLLRQRAEHHPLLALHHADALTFIPPRSDYDLVVSHFFLDCFTDADLAILVPRIAAHTQPNALWVVSEFQIPANRLALPAKLFIRALYLAFRVLTGLRPTKLPDYATALEKAGFQRTAQHASLGGLLVSELWRNPAP